jgi:hypothetical protein
MIAQCLIGGYLRPEFDILLKEIKQPDLYEARDTCVNAKWGRFADKMIAALSSMFRQAVKRGKMDFNPCLGMDKAHEADPNANREWFSPEWEFARDHAPLEVKIPLMLARYAGLRGQAIVVAKSEAFRGPPPDRQVRPVHRGQEQEKRVPAGDAGAARLHGRSEGDSLRRAYRGT